MDKGQKYADKDDDNNNNGMSFDDGWMVGKVTRETWTMDNGHKYVDNNSAFLRDRIHCILFAKLASEKEI